MLSSQLRMQAVASLLQTPGLQSSALCTIALPLPSHWLITVTWSTHLGGKVTIEVVPGANDARLPTLKYPGFSMRLLDGDVEIPFDERFTPSVTRDGDPRFDAQDHLRRHGFLMVNRPGLYRVQVPETHRYFAPAPVDVLLEPGPTPELVFHLDRK